MPIWKFISNSRKWHITDWFLRIAVLSHLPWSSSLIDSCFYGTSIRGHGIGLQASRLRFGRSSGSLMALLSLFSFWMIFSWWRGASRLMGFHWKTCPLKLLPPSDSSWPPECWWQFDERSRGCLNYGWILSFILSLCVFPLCEEFLLCACRFLRLHCLQR